MESNASEKSANKSVTSRFFAQIPSMIRQIVTICVVVYWSKQYPAETITDADYADDIALLANTTTQTESLLYSLEQAVGCIGPHKNVDKTEYMSLNQGVISTVNSSPLKLVDKFMYLSSNIPSTKSDVNMCLVKPLTAIDRVSIIWKSDVSNKIK